MLMSLLGDPYTMIVRSGHDRVDGGRGAGQAAVLASRRINPAPKT
ncbi:MAG: hypothetical protein FWJ87_16685 [Micromonosporaceae bacterium]